MFLCCGRYLEVWVCWFQLMPNKPQQVSSRWLEMHRSVRHRPTRPIVDFRAAIEANDIPKPDYSHIDAFVAQATAFRRRLQEYVIFGKEDIQKQEEDYEKEVQAHQERRAQYQAQYTEADANLHHMIESKPEALPREMI